MTNIGAIVANMLMLFYSESGLVGGYDHPSLRSHETMFLQDDFKFELLSSPCWNQVVHMQGNWKLEGRRVRLEYEQTDRIEDYEIRINFRDPWLVQLRRIPSAAEQIALTREFEDLAKRYGLSAEERLILQGAEKCFLRRTIQPFASANAGGAP